MPFYYFYHNTTLLMLVCTRVCAYVSVCVCVYMQMHAGAYESACIQKAELNLIHHVSRANHMAA